MFVCLQIKCLFVDKINSISVLILCISFVYPVLCQVASKNMRNVIEYYYTWKKYCMDEYKGRSRHYSMEEEVLHDCSQFCVITNLFVVV